MRTDTNCPCGNCTFREVCRYKEDTQLFFKILQKINKETKDSDKEFSHLKAKYECNYYQSTYLYPLTSPYRYPLEPYITPVPCKPEEWDTIKIGDYPNAIPVITYDNDRNIINKSTYSNPSVDTTATDLCSVSTDKNIKSNITLS